MVNLLLVGAEEQWGGCVQGDSSVGEFLWRGGMFVWELQQGLLVLAFIG